ncbi:CBS domain-containing protein [Streptomyces sp. NPDC046939]|uniref:CBS domain-containing protein n=1 Tax=Streptomyces sp. NPDC046939 TaxID=3155376 RepID=UPI0033E3E10A
MADLVREVMRPGAAAVRPEASLVEAAQLMRAQDIGDVLVAEGGRVLGVLTDRDITVRAVAEGADPLTVSAHAVCTPATVVVGPETVVSAAAALMREHAVRRLAVVEGGRAVGIVRMTDLLPPPPRHAPGPAHRPDPRAGSAGAG